MKPQVGVVGMGRMGRAIAARLLASDYDVVVFNRTPGQSMEFVSAGARVAGKPGDAAERGVVVVSALTDDAAVRSVGEDGLLASLEGGVHLSLSTLEPDAAASLAKTHEDVAVRYVSMPVQGRPAGDVRCVELPVTRALERACAQAEESGWGHLDPLAVRRILIKAITA